MQSNDNHKTRVMREVPIEWDRLMKLSEKIRFGKLTIVLKEGKPTDAEHIVPHIKLTGTQEEIDNILKTIAL